MLLSGLKKYPVELSAIVSMADDGGSTGVLRDELGVLPPGDVRQCLVALSESSKEMRELLTYRFSEGSLKGHSFGNLLLSALEKLNGSFADGVDVAMKLLNVGGRVIPVTNQDVRLVIDTHENGSLEGEDQINHSDIQSLGVKKVRFKTKVEVNPKAVEAIQKADAIIIGPGNQYCSILPNLAVSGLGKALKETKAKIVYVANLTNKKGHTRGWEVEDYVDSIEEYIGSGRVDYVMVNSQPIAKTLIERYEAQEGKDLLVKVDLSSRVERSYRLVRARVASGVVPKFDASDAISATRSFIRHDSNNLAQALMLVLELDRDKRIIDEII